MVHTRHSGDADVASPADFLSIRSRSIRGTRKQEADDDAQSDHSGVVHVPHGARRGNHASHSFAESTEGHPKIRNALRSSRKRISYAENDAVEDFLPMYISRRRSEEASKNYSDNNNVDEGIRRSSRTRKLVYGTFDQKILEKALYENASEYPKSTGRKRGREVDTDVTENEYEDMYSRVKRKRTRGKRDMYGIPIRSETEDEDDEDEDEDDSDSSEDASDTNDESNDEAEDEEEEEEEEEKDNSRSYNLREHKPKTKLYESAPIEPKLRRRHVFSETTPDSPVRRKKKHQSYMSPAHRRTNFRRRAAFHGGSSSTSSASGTESMSDEERFERRKAKSMARARSRCKPLNYSSEEILASGILRDRGKVGGSLADIDPMKVDKSITFESVGGLDKHIRALKEMIVFPLLYPEVFERFKITPPRGVLFYGPPGTGKTLVARALTNECSKGDRRVAFFMRKGADCLSKWVGESERQLRMLFDQAYQFRPSIIFFDEIDGLAPVRSSRQDQIHSSIVSTLLALMDGLDSRGEIVVIGATNRIDSIDPALRRPGRFDREFLFPLPSVQARKQIMQIQTQNWNPKLSDNFISELAEKCVGYCGADLKALCTEAALLALRRRYPQIYTAEEKLQLDVSSINISGKDFFHAIENIVPTSQRSVCSPARALSITIAPLLTAQFQRVLIALNDTFPSVLTQLTGLNAPSTSSTQKEGQDGLEDLISDDEDDAPSIFEQKNRKKNPDEPQGQFLSFSCYSYKRPTSHRPRMLLAGIEGQGQTSHIGPAVLHHLEQLPVHVLDLPALYAVSAKTPEESCATIFREAMRTSPSVLYIPRINQWWTVISDTLRATFLHLVQDQDPSIPMLMLATSEQPHQDIDDILQELFELSAGEVVHMTNPNHQARQQYFGDLLLNQATKPPSHKKQSAQRVLEVLPKAPPPEPRRLTDREMEILYEQEEGTLRELRLFIRDVLNKLGRDRKFAIFTKPVDIEDVPDYYEIIKQPMDLSTMMSKIDLHQYQCVKELLQDIDLICSNALEYNPDKDPQSRSIRHRACALKDTAYSIIKNELDPEFEKLCQELILSRKRRGVSPSRTAPNYYYTKSLTVQQPSAYDKSDVSPTRISSRLRHLQVEDLPTLEMVEKTARVERRLSRQEQSPKKAYETTPQGKTEKSKAGQVKHSSQEKNKTARRTPGSSGKSKSRNKCIWAQTKRRKSRKAFGPAVVRTRKKTDDEDEEDMEEDKEDSEEDVENDKSAHSQYLIKPLTIDIDDCGTRSRHNSHSSRSPRGPRSPRSEVQEQSSKRGSDKSPGRTIDKLTSGAGTGPLPLLNGLDSGIGTSDSSNGESNDCIDKAVAGSSKANPDHFSSESTKDSTMAEMADNDVSQAAYRVTRGRMQTKAQQKAMEILENPPPPLVVDRHRLIKLLDLVVEQTEDYTVEELEKLYSLFSHCIFEHRHSYNKTQMILDMERKYSRFTASSKKSFRKPLQNH
ncbi:hypothetical protein ACJMK2_042465 [Sinanodonta woodiana]|uniref:ATPase family AAA domain-containing protein 2 n=1 Tax=Sinanodonta woodiana TaxID=1069815 RepID=A0ABD3W7H5_SINWO